MEDLNVLGDVNVGGKRYALAKANEDASLDECYLYSIKYLVENKDIEEINFVFDKCSLVVNRKTSYEDYINDYVQKRATLNQKAYRNVEEALADLHKIKPADMTVGTTTHAQAYRLCKEIMKVILKSKDLHFTEDEQKQLSRTLKELGCVKYNELNPKFRTDEGRSIVELTRVPKNISFPLSAISNLIDAKRGSFGYIMGKLTEGGNESWLGTWLSTQEEAEQQNQPENE